MSEAADSIASPADDVGASPLGNRWGWAAYLGASWTWCIGMFLPVLLIRDYGPWAWLIFALPNAIGAAAMGWVMRSREVSRDYTVRHASACRLFSFVTISFQLFFSIWMLPRLIGQAGLLVAAALVQCAFTAVRKTSWLLGGGVAALIISGAVAVGLHRNHALDWPPMRSITPGDAIGLALVCLAGFVACPYLDLTFHRGRQSTSDGGAKVAFGVGFCVLFASMIVLTFFYALFMIRLGDRPDGIFRADAAGLLAIHLMFQMGYTIHVHGAELQRQAAARDDVGVMRVGLGLWLAIGLAAGLAAMFGIQHDLSYHGRSLGELCYRLFMSFYGLLFPAYVLLAIGGRRVSVMAWLIISAIASPFYGLAFLNGQMYWAIAGVGVVAVGCLIARRLTPAAPALPSE